MKLFDSVADLAESGYVFRIQDNGGESADRYTVVTCDGDYLAMSAYPTHPQGVSQWGEGLDPQVLSEWQENGEAVDMALGDLPEDIARHVVSRINEAWGDCLASIEARKPSVVAASRDEVDEANEHRGLTDDGGRGIYDSPLGLMVRIDATDPNEDLGPFEGAVAALKATLPTDYSLSGPEYHSTVDVARLVPSPEVAALVAELDAKADAAYAAARGI